MSVNNNNILAAKLLSAIDLMEFGIGLMRQNIKRGAPLASAEEVNQELYQWLYLQDRNFIKIRDESE